MPEIWMPTQLDAIERQYPTPEVKALVAEIRRLNVIAWRAHDVMLQFDQIPTSRDALPKTLRLMLLSPRFRAPDNRNKAGLTALTLCSDLDDIFCSLRADKAVDQSARTDMD